MQTQKNPDSHRSNLCKSLPRLPPTSNEETLGFSKTMVWTLTKLTAPIQEQNKPFWLQSKEKKTRKHRKILILIDQPCTHPFPPPPPTSNEETLGFPKPWYEHSRSSRLHIQGKKKPLRLHIKVSQGWLVIPRKGEERKLWWKSKHLVCQTRSKRRKNCKENNP